MKTAVVNLRKNKYDFYIGRANPRTGLKGSIFANPFKIDTKEGITRERSIELYKEYFYARLKNESEFKEAVLKLKGKRLGCWCKPLPCHGDIIVEYLETSRSSGNTLRKTKSGI